MIGKRILVTGGAGSIGSELVRQLAKDNKVYVLDNNESGLFDILQETGAKGRVGDIRNDRTVRDVFSDIKPQIVFHAAAYKHVPLMETVPLEAIETNVLGTYNILYYSGVYSVEKLVYVSTDKVVNAKSVMGQTKKLGETMVTNAGHIAVRFGNVMGSRGSVLPIWEKQIANGGPVTVTDERMTRYFMEIPQAVSLLLHAAEEANGGEVLILDMGEPKKIVDVAREMIAGRDIKIEFIGIRAGETLDEHLMSEEEERRAIKRDKYFVI